MSTSKKIYSKQRHGHALSFKQVTEENPRKQKTTIHYFHDNINKQPTSSPQYHQPSSAIETNSDVEQKLVETIKGMARQNHMLAVELTITKRKLRRERKKCLWLHNQKLHYQQKLSLLEKREQEGSCTTNRVEPDDASGAQQHQQKPFICSSNKNNNVQQVKAEMEKNEEESLREVSTTLPSRSIMDNEASTTIIQEANFGQFWNTLGSGSKKKRPSVVTNKPFFDSEDESSGMSEAASDTSFNISLMPDELIRAVSGQNTNVSTSLSATFNTFEEEEKDDGGCEVTEEFQQQDCSIASSESSEHHKTTGQSTTGQIRKTEPCLEVEESNKNDCVSSDASAAINIIENNTATLTDQSSLDCINIATLDCASPHMFIGGHSSVKLSPELKKKKKKQLSKRHLFTTAASKNNDDDGDKENLKPVAAVVVTPTKYRSSLHQNVKGCSSGKKKGRSEFHCSRQPKVMAVPLDSLSQLSQVHPEEEVNLETREQQLFSPPQKNAGHSSSCQRPRRSALKPRSYKEPNLNVKIRQGHNFFEKIEKAAKDAKL